MPNPEQPSPDGNETTSHIIDVDDIPKSSEIQAPPPDKLESPEQRQDRVNDARAEIEKHAGPEMKTGKYVTVKRTSGEAETGWVVDSIENGVATVSRPDLHQEKGPDGVIEKQVPVEKLTRWQEEKIPLEGVSLGSEVKVKRSNGDIEAGWQFAGWDKGRARVVKGDLEKSIPAGELAAWQWLDPSKAASQGEKQEAEKPVNKATFWSRLRK